MLKISAAGFSYSGVKAAAWGVCFVTVFSLFPDERVSERVKSFIRKAGRYTLGIYCMYYVIGICLNKGIKLSGILVPLQSMFLVLYCICSAVYCVLC